MHIAVPLIAFLYLVAADSVSKVAYDIGLLKRLVIDGNDTHACRFESAVKVHSDGYALDLRSLFRKLLQILLELVEMRVCIDLIDVRPVILKALRLDPLIAKTLLKSVNASYVITVLV